MYCKKCGEKIEGTMNFCPKCGTKIEESNFLEMNNHEVVNTCENKPDSEDGKTKSEKNKNQGKSRMNLWGWGMSFFSIFFAVLLFSTSVLGSICVIISAILFCPIMWKKTNKKVVCIILGIIIYIIGWGMILDNDTDVQELDPRNQTTTVKSEMTDKISTDAVDNNDDNIPRKEAYLNESVDCGKWEITLLSATVKRGELLGDVFVYCLCDITNQSDSIQTFWPDWLGMDNDGIIDYGTSDYDGKGISSNLTITTTITFIFPENSNTNIFNMKLTVDDKYIYLYQRPDEIEKRDQKSVEIGKEIYYSKSGLQLSILKNGNDCEFIAYTSLGEGQTSIQYEGKFTLNDDITIPVAVEFTDEYRNHPAISMCYPDKNTDRIMLYTDLGNSMEFVKESGQYLNDSFEVIKGYDHSAEQVESCDEELYRGEEYSLIPDLNIGDVYTFGTYVQNSKEEEPIEWLVLDKEGTRVLLLSRYALDRETYSYWSDPKWESSHMREWLNASFYNSAFSIEEKNKIVETLVIAEENPKYNSEVGNDTMDKVFLLSISEVEKYFNSDGERKCEVTKYAQGGKAVTSYDGICGWFLRTPGSFNNSVVAVSTSGKILYSGCFCDDSVGIRPAMWIDLAEG